MTAPAPEKAAPIPADERQRLIERGADSVALDLAKAVTERIGRSDWTMLTNLIHCAIIDGAAILADREARPSLPDSREERIREDERDRIYERAERHASGKMPDANAAAAWLTREEDVMLHADRARVRQGGNNG